MPNASCSLDRSRPDGDVARPIALRLRQHLRRPSFCLLVFVGDPANFPPFISPPSLPPSLPQCLSLPPFVPFLPKLDSSQQREEEEEREKREEGEEGRAPFSLQHEIGLFVTLSDGNGTQTAENETASPPDEDSSSFPVSNCKLCYTIRKLTLNTLLIDSFKKRGKNS